MRWWRGGQSPGGHPHPPCGPWRPLGRSAWQPGRDLRAGGSDSIHPVSQEAGERGWAAWLVQGSLLRGTHRGPAETTFHQERETLNKEEEAKIKRSSKHVKEAGRGEGGHCVRIPPVSGARPWPGAWGLGSPCGRGAPVSCDSERPAASDLQISKRELKKTRCSQLRGPEAAGVRQAARVAGVAGAFFSF